MNKYGIDWIKIALAVNDERKRAIKNGAHSSDAFNIAYRVVVGQYPEITGDAWKAGRTAVGVIMAGWKKEKSQTVRIAKKVSVLAIENTKRQGELEL